MLAALEGLWLVVLLMEEQCRGADRDGGLREGGKAWMGTGGAARQATWRSSLGWNGDRALLSRRSAFV